jgi:hypothetical protein
VKRKLFVGVPNDGKAANFITPGTAVWSPPAQPRSNEKPGRLGLTIGAGEQIASTHFDSTNHNLCSLMPF